MALPNAITPTIKREKIGHIPKSVSLDDRRQTILKFLTDKKISGIKDIYGVVSGCSEKTVQRELASLVRAGLIRREGERRWSQYHLIS